MPLRTLTERSGYRDEKTWSWLSLSEQISDKHTLDQLTHTIFTWIGVGTVCYIVCSLHHTYSEAEFEKWKRVKLADKRWSGGPVVEEENRIFKDTEYWRFC